MTHPRDRKIPMQERKFRMYEKGLIIDAVRIKVRDSEAQFEQQCEELFRDKLQGSRQVTIYIN